MTGMLLLTLLVSWGLTGWVRRYALARSLLDIPNARSSHTTPTPRGGGLAIVLAFLLALPVLASQGRIESSLIWALAGTGAWIALLGFLDDHQHIPARWRLLGHVVGAVWALYWLGGMPPVELLGVKRDLGWAGHLLAVLGLVWLLNLYNFMDGIDGIASIETISVCLGGIVLYWVSGNVQLMWVPLALAVAVLGFLYWNFPPASIFMGDAGSGFLGIALGVMALQAAWISPELLWGWLILLGVFIVDATLTLLHRVVRGERVYEAHRSHAYQYASRCFGGHLPVTLAVAVLNFFWLFPVALWVIVGDVSGLLGLVVAYFPLIVIAWKFRAGAPD